MDLYKRLYYTFVHTLFKASIQKTHPTRHNMDLHEPLRQYLIQEHIINHVQQGLTWSCMNLLDNTLFKSLYKPCPTRTYMDLHEPLIQFLFQELI